MVLPSIVEPILSSHLSPRPSSDAPWPLQSCLFFLLDALSWTVFSVIVMSAAFITIFSASYFGALGYVLSFVSMYRLSSGSDSCSPSIATAASTTVSFWRELLFYVLDGRYGESPVFSKEFAWVKFVQNTCLQHLQSGHWSTKFGFCKFRFL